MNKKWKKGFSLVEVIIVLGIIAIIASIAIPSASGLIDQAKATKVVTNMRTLQTSIIQYSIYNDDLTELNYQKLIDSGFLSDTIPNLSFTKAEFSDEITISYDLSDPDITKLKSIDSQIQLISDKPSLVFKVR